MANGRKLSRLHGSARRTVANSQSNHDPHFRFAGAAVFTGMSLTKPATIADDVQDA
jgi:hypothetical protein